MSDITQATMEIPPDSKKIPFATYDSGWDVFCTAIFFMPVQAGIKR